MMSRISVLIFFVLLFYTYVYFYIWLVIALHYIGLSLCCRWSPTSLTPLFFCYSLSPCLLPLMNRRNLCVLPAVGVLPVRNFIPATTGTDCWRSTECTDRRMRVRGRGLVTSRTKRRGFRQDARWRVWGSRACPVTYRTVGKNNAWFCSNYCS